MATNRLLFALKPARSALAGLAAARRNYCPASAIPDSHWHITLDLVNDLGTVSDGILRRLLAAGSLVDAAGFIVRLERIVGLRGWVGLRAARRSAAVNRLHGAVRSAMLGTGLQPRDGWTFNPHLTLGYPAGQPFSRAIPPIEWTAADLVLIHSHLGQTRHDIVGRWPLAPELPLFD